MFGRLQTLGRSFLAEKLGELLRVQFRQPLERPAAGPAGAHLDIPVHHKKAMLVRSHFDAMEICVPDAPATDEILVAVAVTNGGRPHARVGGLKAGDAVGEDGLR